ncbi:bifunctional PIG-L family deacetylase/class I SAM-dependent methyltransferase [Microbacterium sp. CFBP9034]|uniref:bifunctional PIG-L family deacetylase/class I SAM-dependent methyltransferase n=1 Tax=Microbacterium sp. CFBP9034 TaxID=3096540 RepID=UPI002A6AE4BB|nr:bifunctional PIG-L family deacetylase/class I SAM-dependent methyltransferase [Microbacterium sp. CFBP9034]MDY0908782.1 bifunctional PIG-L family deacetylase/class I SAM-dependent methyltransferase [Microbacterium sp. CFBP9034]
MSVRFSHLDPGTDETYWQEALGEHSIAPMDADVDLLIVVAAHPDDETLGAAGLMARATGRGTPVVVVLASDGEGSHPSSPTHSPEQLASLRRRETEHAVSLVAPRADIRFLGLPDGELAEHAAELRAHLVAVVDEAPAAGAHRVLVAAPWSGDGHRDHRIVAEVCASVCAPRGLIHVGYPVWVWHWGGSADLPWSRVMALRLSDDEAELKRRAIALHVTQVEALSPRRGDEVLLHAGMRSHFERDIEVFLRESEEPAGSNGLDAAWFDAFYDRNADDPWGFETRWYEERKRAILFATLPERGLGAVLELGCATGILTAELALRAERVVAIDAAEAAVAQARRRLGDDPRVTVLHAAVPDLWPAGEFDTIVLSEVGYYLTGSDLRRLVHLIAGSLSERGCVVACHWRHPVAEYPLTGDDVHDALNELIEWQTLVTHREQDFVLEVFAPLTALSVAEREGLV